MLIFLLLLLLLLLSYIILICISIKSDTDLLLSDEQLHNLTLIEIEKLLQSSRRSLKEFKSLPYPDGYLLEQLGNRLIYDEHNYDTTELQIEFQELFSSLTGIILLYLAMNLI